MEIQFATRVVNIKIEQFSPPSLPSLEVQTMNISLLDFINLPTNR